MLVRLDGEFSVDGTNSQPAFTGLVKRSGLLELNGERQVLGQPTNDRLAPHFDVVIFPWARDRNAAIGLTLGTVLHRCLVADFVDLRYRHDLEGRAAILELGVGVEVGYLSARTVGGAMNQLFLEAVSEVKLVVHADFVRRNADDLAAAAGKVDQPLVADDDLHKFARLPASITGFLVLLERHHVGVPKDRVRFKAEHRALSNGSDEAGNLALEQGRRGCCRNRGDLE